MKAVAIRDKYLKFFQDKGHAVIPPAPIVPIDDATTLFTGFGMQQLVPYLKGEPHPQGTRLVDAQPCFRAEDIEEVGDNRHTTFFEMLGNWSLGDYFKEDQLKWFWEFLTQELGLEENRLHVTLFEGSREVPRDEESYQVWKGLGLADDHIHWYDATKNWWSRAGMPDEMPAGEIGGPTSEIFYEFADVTHDAKYGEECHINCDCGKYLEIGNSVFMEYEKIKNGLKKLPTKNVDFGGGLERITQVVQKKSDMFEIDMFQPIILEIEKNTDQKYEGENKKPMRIIADHLRAATFMIAEGIEPSNKMHGYVLRRLLRRAAIKMHQLKGGLTPIPGFQAICEEVLIIYDRIYFDRSLVRNTKDKIIDQEMSAFSRSLDKGLKLLEKFTPEQMTELNAFNLFQTHGFPFEITQELFQQKGFSLDKEKFNQILQDHKNLSRKASAGMFKGGLADHSEEVTKLHTATHLLHQAMRMVLGEEVTQAGSNITSERLRFDYTSSHKPTPDELSKIEDLINQKIQEDLPVHKTIEAKDSALKSGALAFFHEKYADQVSVYTIGEDPSNDWFSKELCGGPHVNSTGEIGGVTIKKDKSLGTGKRRIYVNLTK